MPGEASRLARIRRATKAPTADMCERALLAIFLARPCVGLGTLLWPHARAGLAVLVVPPLRVSPERTLGGMTPRPFGLGSPNGSSPAICPGKLNLKGCFPVPCSPEGASCRASLPLRARCPPTQPPKVTSEHCTFEFLPELNFGGEDSVMFGRTAVLLAVAFAASASAYQPPALRPAHMSKVLRTCASA